MAPPELQSQSHTAELLRPAEQQPPLWVHTAVVASGAGAVGHPHANFPTFVAKGEAP